MNLSYAYNKLFSVPGYSFIATPDGEAVDWDSDFMRIRGLHSGTGSARMHLVPGSFYPLHQTHREIYSLIEAPAEHAFFEMSVERVDKAMVTLPELDERLRQFRDYAPVVISRAPRFVTKIGTYLGYLNKLTFHVGIDTITRMADDYGIFGIQGLAASFVVHDRIMNGRRLSLSSEFGNHIPRNCTPSPVIRSEESLSRSSSEIRRQQNGV